MSDGGPAFPFDCSAPDDDARTIHTGMSLRDYFAGQIIVALIRNRGPHLHDTDAERAECARDSAAAAYEYADAMIGERTNTTKGQP